MTELVFRLFFILTKFPELPVNSMLTARDIRWINGDKNNENETEIPMKEDINYV